MKLVDSVLCHFLGVLVVLLGVHCVFRISGAVVGAGSVFRAGPGGVVGSIGVLLLQSVGIFVVLVCLHGRSRVRVVVQHFRVICASDLRRRRSSQSLESVGQSEQCILTAEVAMARTADAVGARAAVAATEKIAVEERRRDMLEMLDDGMRCGLLGTKSGLCVASTMQSLVIARPMADY